MEYVHCKIAGCNSLRKIVLVFEKLCAFGHDCTSLRKFEPGFVSLFKTVQVYAKFEQVCMKLCNFTSLGLGNLCAFVHDCTSLRETVRV